jgi:hypothetical protein
MRVKYINKYLVGGGGGGEREGGSKFLFSYKDSSPALPSILSRVDFVAVRLRALFCWCVFVPLSSVTNRLVSMGKGIVTILHGRVVRLVVFLSE